MAFYTIHTPPNLDAVRRSQARRLGPSMVNSRDAYMSLLTRAGFARVRAIDMTGEFLRISRAWLRSYERHEAGLRNALGDARVREMLADNRMNLEGIRRGLLRRSLFVAVR